MYAISYRDEIRYPKVTRADGVSDMQQLNSPIETISQEDVDKMFEENDEAAL